MVASCCDADDVIGRKEALVRDSDIMRCSMKRIAFTLAVLALSTGTALAAPASAPPTAPNGPKAHATAVTNTTMMRNAPDAKRMTKALNLLEAKGYGTFNDFKADGKD